MDAEVKLRWVNALRSGDYKQDRHHLATDSGYCCLGVLCEIAVQDQVVIKEKRNYSSLFSYTSKIDVMDMHTAVPPDAIKNWAGLDKPNPSILIDVDRLPKDQVIPEYVIEGKVRTSLADLNDAYHMSFNQIADVIEDYL